MLQPFAISVFSPSIFVLSASKWPVESSITTRLFVSLSRVEFAGAASAWRPSLAIDEGLVGVYGPVAGVPSGFELYMPTLAVSDPPNCRMSVSTVESVYPFSLSPVVNCCARLSSKAPTVPVSYSALAFVGWPASFTRVAAGFSSSTATDVDRDGRHEQHDRDGRQEQHDRKDAPPGQQCSRTTGRPS